MVKFSTEPNMEIEFTCKGKRSSTVKRYFSEFAVHGASSKGQILMRREVESIKYRKCAVTEGAQAPIIENNTGEELKFD